MPRKTKYDTAFGASASVRLAEARMTQVDLAKAMGKPVPYVNQTLTGRKPANAAWVDLVCDVMNLDHDKRVEMHRAAARDAGFRLD
jgi:cyanate lyase